MRPEPSGQGDVASGRRARQAKSRKFPDPLEASSVQKCKDGPDLEGTGQAFPHNSQLPCRVCGESHPPQPPPNKAQPPPSHPQGQACRHLLHLAIQRHPHFRGLFNFSVPVLLWGELFTPELWDRLSQHKAPYGWRGLSYQGNPGPLSLTCLLSASCSWP